MFRFLRQLEHLVYFPPFLFGELNFFFGLAVHSLLKLLVFFANGDSLILELDLALALPNPLKLLFLLLPSQAFLFQLPFPVPQGLFFLNVHDCTLCQIDLHPHDHLLFDLLKLQRLVVLVLARLVLVQVFLLEVYYIGVDARALLLQHRGLRVLRQTVFVYQHLLLLLQQLLSARARPALRVAGAFVFLILLRNLVV